MTSDIRSIAIADIDVLNPRTRNKRIFDELVESIASVGLKRPITVRRADGGRYELICGQGRMEAVRRLGETRVPARVTDATREESYVMSLVENLARRNLRPLDMIRDVRRLREQGYSHSRIGEKIGFSAEHVQSICVLIENGEDRLLDAVERGIVPHTIAAQIARAKDFDVQRALTEAYEQGALPGDQVLAIRRIVDDRNLMGRTLQRAKGGGRRSPPPTAATLVRAYQKEVDRQQVMVKKATLTQSKLAFVVGAMSKLLAEEHFVTLLRAEGLASLPQPIADRLDAASAT